MRKTLIVLALTFAAACSKAPKPATAPRASADILKREELATVTVDNLYDAVMRLRPSFLRTRSTGTTNQATPVVYVDGIRRGTIETLRQIPVGTVSEIRYLSAIDASTRFGLNVEAGVLQVTTAGRK